MKNSGFLPLFYHCFINLTFSIDRTIMGPAFNFRYFQPFRLNNPTAYNSQEKR